MGGVLFVAGFVDSVVVGVAVVVCVAVGVAVVFGAVAVLVAAVVDGGSMSKLSRQAFFLCPTTD